MRVIDKTSLSGKIELVDFPQRPFPRTLDRLGGLFKLIFLDVSPSLKGDFYANPIIH